MFRSRVSGVFQQVRFQSTAASKAASKAQGLGAKVQGITNCAVYWAKVTGELGKQIYLKEGFAPPSLSQFQSVYQNLFNSVKSYALKPQKVIDCAESITKTDALRYTAYGVQILGLFTLGEVIGRRNVIGYKVPSADKH
ncbi:mitochondrial ATP synthase g subunit-domain-containing protein [Yarrowia lipolytica]|uniref:ATP synthase subunit g, mitochondrial n=2 Tax=Yarrowia lipolytica TaxID=4952 RepID=ATPN_YARLI|nr:YALI0B21527p [Yarrowia lipolytica CLIB122]B5FVB8.1 RecName: Full=ATP synthase subunit g, mitochondrial; Short=ATPase subunit g [Yarrowia lipolytica CLIB122]AOW02032.1 hypothetical protein YALI1_B28025g [Yarrowia lipolytica]KAB8283423.1 mitochondrial ATP synthase g subunit-domain-containing protein [Yarrowia lipolytica]KAE8173344.1 mitochondrial ATP synthase g subunit-domain-containing protein [Yarrowia lipolytica]KAJ8052800.1 mitochondrial ATP synthase g subunit-domain-containing protein [Y|eukprot:XP_002143021.1 YALI0B21527p [Yarrowia lipolytica CLIB122]